MIMHPKDSRYLIRVLILVPVMFEELAQLSLGKK